MVELIMTYEWAIVFLGVIAYGIWELISVRRSQRRANRRTESDSKD